METIYFAFLVSIVRTSLTVAGAWLVQRGMVEDGLAREVAAGLAVIVVSQVWGFVRARRRELFQRWLVVLGLEAEPTTDPAVAESITAEAKVYAKSGMLP